MTNEYSGVWAAPLPNKAEHYTVIRYFICMKQTYTVMLAESGTKTAYEDLQPQEFTEQASISGSFLIHYRPQATVKMMSLIRNTLHWYKDYSLVSFHFFRNEITVTVILFVVGGFMGYFDLLSLNEVIADIFRKLVNKFSEYEGVVLFFNIFIQNARATLVIICSGIFFSFFPVLATVLNGMIIGYIIGNIESFSNLTKLEGLLYTLPHGIFEIPAVILAISLGIKIGLWPFYKNKIHYIKKAAVRSIQCYLIIIIPLLLIAGFIEAHNIEALKNSRQYTTWLVNYSTQ
jgi:stage II sporulation protein M